MAEPWDDLTELRFVGEASAERLYAHGFESRADVCGASEEVLVHLLGPNGYRVARENRVEDVVGAGSGAGGGLRERLGEGLKRFRSFFGETNRRIGIYGPPNAGKTSLANRIARDWGGEAVGIVSGIPHETRDVQTVEGVWIEGGDGSVALDLVDTPGFASSAYVEELEEHRLSDEAVKERERQVNEGVRHALRIVDGIDVAVIVLDAARDNDEPDSLTLLGALERAGIPQMVVANKVDLAAADPGQVRETYAGKRVVAISARDGDGMDAFYEAVVELARQA